jgi:hypothetical protein
VNLQNEDAILHMARCLLTNFHWHKPQGVDELARTPPKEEEVLSSTLLNFYRPPAQDLMVLMEY